MLRFFARSNKCASVPSVIQYLFVLGAAPRFCFQYQLFLKSLLGNWLLNFHYNRGRQPNPDAEAVAVYFTGAYCLERDVLLKRKISLPQLPEIGDTVLFVNTAGYMMHFFETEAHLFERAKNLSITDDSEVFTLKDIQAEL